MAKKYWSCIIGGEVGELLPGSDFVLRHAVRCAYQELTDESDEVCSSGWGIDEERYKLLRRLEVLSTDELKELLDKRSRIFTLKNRD